MESHLFYTTHSKLSNPSTILLSEYSFRICGLIILKGSIRITWENNSYLHQCKQYNYTCHRHYVKVTLAGIYKQLSLWKHEQICQIRLVCLRFSCDSFEPLYTLQTAFQIWNDTDIFSELSWSSLLINTTWLHFKFGINSRSEKLCKLNSKQPPPPPPHTHSHLTLIITVVQSGGSAPSARTL